MKLLKGIVTAMLTPFAADGSVSVPAIEALCDYLIDSGVDCLYPTGSVGEMLRMTAQERKLVAETVVKRTAGRVPVYVHVGAVTTKETVELAQHAQQCGADGVGVVTPMYFPVPEHEMEAFFCDVASSVDFPVYMYAIPQYAANDISPDLAARVRAKCKNVVGIKCSTPSPTRVMDYIAIGGFEVLQGQDRATLPYLAVDGIAGIVSGGSSAYPAPYVSIRRALLAGDLHGAQYADALLQEYLALIQFGSIAIEKAFLTQLGLDAGAPRLPAQPATGEQIAAIKAFIAQKNIQSLVQP